MATLVTGTAVAPAERQLARAAPCGSPGSQLGGKVGRVTQGDRWRQSSLPAGRNSVVPGVIGSESGGGFPDSPSYPPSTFPKHGG